MRFYVLIKPVSIHDHLIAKDLMVATEINAEAPRPGKREQKLIKVKARELTGARPNPRIRIKKTPACRAHPFEKIWSRCKSTPPRIKFLPTSAPRHIAAELKII